MKGTGSRVGVRISFNLLTFFVQWLNFLGTKDLHLHRSYRFQCTMSFHLRPIKQKSTTLVLLRTGTSYPNTRQHKDNTQAVNSGIFFGKNSGESKLGIPQLTLATLLWLFIPFYKKSESVTSVVHRFQIKRGANNGNSITL